jgi:adenine-specific DNA-methyltransferase
MKYIGNKSRLIGFIEDCLIDSEINYKNALVYDLFSGTGSVSEFFLKNNCDVLSCDNMNYAIVEQYRKLFFREEPVFTELKEIIGLEKLDDILEYLNNLEGKKGYFFENFCEDGKYKRKFFSSENAEKIDAIREKIEEWKDVLPSEKYMLLVGILMNSADFVSNTAGTYGAYLKIWRSMALKKLKLEKAEFINSGSIKLYVDDVISFVDKNKEADIVYLDPPYNTRQYPANFSVLESIVVNDNQVLKGKTGLRNYEKQKSKFAIKKEVSNEFKKLISKINARYIIMSYSTEGILNKDFIKEVLDNRGVTKVYNTSYRRFKTNAWTNKNTNLNEILFVCKVGM